MPQRSEPKLSEWLSIHQRGLNFHTCTDSPYTFNRYFVHWEFQERIFELAMLTEDSSWYELGTYGDLETAKIAAQLNEKSICGGLTNA